MTTVTFVAEHASITMRSAVPLVTPPATATAASDLSSFACPCCEFLFPEEGLFLPSNYASSSAATAPSPNVGEASDNGDSNDEAPSPRAAYDVLLQRFGRRQEVSSVEDEEAGYSPPPFFMVDTHCHAHLGRENRSGDDGIYVLPYEEEVEEEAVGEGIVNSQGDDGTNDRRTMDSPRRRRLTSVVSLTCAVAPADWEACLAHAASSPRRLSALGVHPWYLSDILALEPNSESGADDSPSAPSSAAGETSPSQTPLPTPLASTIARGDWLQKLKGLLLKHPGCLVGEIGLCKQARFVRTYEGGKAEALALQREVFRAQLVLACELRRSASVHCVNQHNALLEVLQSLVELLLTNQQSHQETRLECPPPALYLPPAIALHSFTGTANQVRQLLAWEASVPVHVRCPGTFVDNSVESMEPLRPLLYFGFSHAVNVAMASTSSAKSRRQGRDAVRAVPSDRLLAESDVSHPGDVAGGTLGAIAYLATACTAQDEKRHGVPADSILRMAKVTSENGIRFLRQQQSRQREDE